MAKTLFHIIELTDVARTDGFTKHLKLPGEIELLKGVMIVPGVTPVNSDTSHLGNISFSFGYSRPLFEGLAVCCKLDSGNIVDKQFNLKKDIYKLYEFIDNNQDITVTYQNFQLLNTRVDILIFLVYEKYHKWCKNNV